MQLTKVLKFRYTKKVNQQAASKIQFLWKRYYARKKFIINSQKRHDSAKLIQKNWKIYKQIILTPRKEL